jgi:hypothetical protein
MRGVQLSANKDLRVYSTILMDKLFNIFYYTLHDEDTSVLSSG